MGFSGTPIMGPPYGKRDPYYSHTTPVRIPKDMGMVWVPLTIRGSHVLGGPWNILPPKKTNGCTLKTNGWTLKTNGWTLNLLFQGSMFGFLGFSSFSGYTFNF